MQAGRRSKRRPECKTRLSRLYAWVTLYFLADCLQAQVPVPANTITSMASRNGCVYVGRFGGSIEAIDIQTGNTTWKKMIHAGCVNAIDISGEKSEARGVSVEELKDETSRMVTWNAATGGKIDAVNLNMSVDAVGFVSTDDEIAAVGWKDICGVVARIDRNKHVELLRSPEDIPKLPNVARFSSLLKLGNRDVLFGSENSYICKWKIGDGSLKLTGYNSEKGEYLGRVQTMALLPDGGTVITGSYEGSLATVDIGTGRVKSYQEFSGLPSGIKGLFARDSQIAAVMGSEVVVMRSGPLRYEIVKRMPSGHGQVANAVYDEVHNAVILGHVNGAVTRWQLDGKVGFNWGDYDRLLGEQGGSETKPSTP